MYAFIHYYRRTRRNKMVKTNVTVISNFIFLGFSYYPKVDIAIFVLCLLMYLITLLGNMILISITILDSHLHTPMYFFLSNLSVLDIWYTSSALTPMLVNFVSGKNTISFSGCATQMYFSLAMGSTECVLLSVMAYDRYVAICNPLRYPIIMNKRVCVQIAAGTWVTGCLTALVGTMSVLHQSLCGNSIINHFTCEILAVLKLVCSDTSKVQLIMLVISILLLPMPMLFICLSYAFILSNILRIGSVDGRSKAFSTCAAHLTVVILFYGTALSMYLKPSAVDSQEIDKFMAFVYAGLTPMLNPIIYSLRNKEVKAAVKKLLIRHPLRALLIPSSK
uniref:Olfactory receptor n=1 Tax=Equus asinus TaxID=9793 RepID=A0A8C4N7M0_EQUAS|nr:olfactory receptor 13F1-like [Equus asinus]